MSKHPFRTLCVALALVAATPTVNAFASDDYDSFDLPTNAAETDWTGFYVGILGGAGAGTATADSTNVQMTGANFGVRAGFDFQNDNLVFGALATVQKTGLSGSTTCNNPAFTCQGALESLGTIEARIGFAKENALFYAKGGAAYAYSSADVDPTYSDYYFGSLGWTAGAGIEVALNDSISVFGEYNYLSVAPHTTAAGVLEPGTTVLSGHAHMVQGGMNVHF